MKQPKSVFSGVKTAGLIYLGAIALMVVYLFYLFQYVFSGRDKLLHKYFPIEACFYKANEFGAKYFTEHVKAQGNAFAGIGIGLCIALIGYCAYRYSKLKANDVPAEALKKQMHWTSYAVPVLLIVPAYIWYKGQLLLAPSGDEIFSAVYCAEGSLIRTWAYYMMPNNHVFFNLLNNLVAKVSFCDAVYTGRTISFVAYLAMLAVAFRWMNRLVKNWVVAAIGCLPIAVQFTTFILEQQNRGYGLQLLFAWLAFVSLFSYLDNKSEKSLRLFTVASILGMACIPTYSYFLAAQLLLCVCIQVYERKVDYKIIVHAGLVACGVFLFYLPALCYSGLDALINNEYVKAGSGDYVDFIPGFYIVLKTSGNSLFTNLIEQDHWINMVLFLLPILLLFARKRQHRLVGIFYILLWIVWGVFCFKMHRLPYYRNMVLHFSLSVAIVVYTFYLLAAKIFALVKPGLIRYTFVRAIFVVPVLMVGYHQYAFCYNKENFSEEREKRDHILNEINNLDKAVSIGCSPYSFCYYYFARKAGHVSSYCLPGNERYYINMDKEPLPQDILNNFTLQRKLPDGYELYQRKN